MPDRLRDLPPVREVGLWLAEHLTLFGVGSVSGEGLWRRVDEKRPVDIIADLAFA